MCGHVGIAGDLHYRDEFTMRRLLLFDYFRGPDSTGMGAVRTNGDIVFSKIASNPIDLFNLESFKKALNGNGSRAFIGHNRAATRGGVNTCNAHPFHVDHILFAHNGTLDYQSFRALKDDLKEEFAVDSMAMAHHVAKFGVEKTIAKCTTGKDSKEGAWALVWFDQRDKSLNFLRNKHRQLYYAFTTDFKQLFWASEWWMLREAMETSENKYEIYTEEDKDGNNIGFFTFDEDVHYKFDLAKLCAGSKKRPKPSCKKLAGKEPVVGNNTAPFEGGSLRMGFGYPGTNGIHTTNVGTANSRQNAGSTNSGTTSKSHGEKPRTVLHMKGKVEQPYANVIDEARFAMLAYEGCAFCERPVEYGEPGVTIFEEDGRLLCRKCSGYPEDHPNPPSKIYVRGSVIDALS